MVTIGTTELMIVAVVLVIGVLAAGRWGALRDVADETVAPWPDTEVLDAELFARLRDVPRLPLVASRPGLLVLARRSVPWWAVTLAVVLFPIGLLCLLVRDERRIEVTTMATSTGTRVRVVGRARRSDVEAVGTAVRAAVGAPAARV